MTDSPYLKNDVVTSSSECHRWSGINDVSDLGNVHEQNLSLCCAIEGVSSLTGVHMTLDLTGCWRVTDVSALGNCFFLDLTSPRREFIGRCVFSD